MNRFSKKASELNFSVENKYDNFRLIITYERHNQANTHVKSVKIVAQSPKKTTRSLPKSLRTIVKPYFSIATKYNCLPVLVRNVML